MTASPAVAPPIPDATPLAGGEEAPPAGPNDGTVEEPPRASRRKIAILLVLLAVFAALMGLAVWYLLFRQPLPLPAIPGEVVMPTYTTSYIGMNRPMGVATTADGSRVYIGETEGDRIARVFEGGGSQLGLMQPPISTGADHVPVYLAVDPVNGEVYVSDRPTGSLYVYDAAGTYQREFQPEGMDGWQPLAVAFDAQGSLYVADLSTSPQAILVFDRDGRQTASIGGDANMSFPNGIAVDEAGNVYVTDGNNGRLLVFDPEGRLAAQVGRGAAVGNLGLPRGIGIDGQGRVYVADATGQGVFVYSTLKPGENRLEYLGFFGAGGVENGAFMYPNGLAVDGRGRIYITDSGNDRVQVWSY